ncbi:MAG: aldehyde ferredoxin oxidoreductase family protein [Candidatus Kariarchaeaceae archaeon]
MKGEPLPPVDLERGYANRYLLIDMATKSLIIEPLDPDMRDNYQGGRGFAAKWIYEMTDAATDPLGPDNVLVIALGPMIGYRRWPGACKINIGSISPHTNLFGESSMGGRFGESVKYAGFDALVVTGKSDEPLVVVIDTVKQEMKFISPPNQTDFAIDFGKELIEQFEDKNIPTALTIGLSGKKLGNHSCVSGIHYDKGSDEWIPRQAGRTGQGAVMGSKNLLGIVINAPKIDHHPAKEEVLIQACKGIKYINHKYDSKQLNMKKYGSPVLTSIGNQKGIEFLPIRNFKEGHDPEAEKIHVDRFIEDNNLRTSSCYPGCSLQCAKLSDTTLPDGTPITVEGPEYETIALVGANLAIWSTDWILRYNWICDQYGMDTISVGATIGFLMELMEDGIITKDDIGGFDLRFGNAEEVWRFIPFIAKREGIGDIISAGMVACIDYFMDSKFKNEPMKRLKLLERAPQAKRLEWSGFRTQLSIAQQLSYGTSDIGAHHRQSWLIFMDSVRNDIPTHELKAETHIWFQNFRTWYDIIGLCRLHGMVKHPDATSAKNLPSAQFYLDATTGMLGNHPRTNVPWTFDDVIEIAERVYNIVRLLNIRRNLTREDDQVPKIMRGNFSEEDYDNLLSVYYAARGWDDEGVPLPQTLEKYNIQE